MEQAVHFIRCDKSDAINRTNYPASISIPPGMEMGKTNFSEIVIKRYFAGCKRRKKKQQQQISPGTLALNLPSAPCSIDV